MAKWVCVNKTFYDRIRGVPIYYCEKILLRGKDVTKFIKGMYLPEKNEVWITEYADERTIAHEVAHAYLKRKYPELHELAEKDKEIAFRIEKMARKLEKKIMEEYL